MTYHSPPDYAPSPVRRAPGPRASGARTAARGVGELLITAGLVLLLFVAYQLVWTNYQAGRAQDGVSDQIIGDWQRPPASGTGGQGAEPSLKPLRSGKGFAFLHIPRLGRRYSVPVVQGVSLDDLAKGIGHYPKTALPGEVGNFAVAGHRATHGEPFAYLDEVRKGDAVIAETETEWFTYIVDRTRIVQPTDVWVLDPVPGKPRAVPEEQLITLTTCNPRWASTERLIVFGHLESRQSKAAGPPAELRRKA